MQSNKAIPQKIRDTLKQVVNGAIDNYEVRVHDPNQKGEGYLGQMVFITLQEKGTGKELNLAVKQAFSEDNIRKHNPIRDAFLNEIYFYTELWPKLSKLQEGVPEKYNFHHLPKCLAVNSEDKYERLVLENLKQEGFAMHDKTKALDVKMYEEIFKVYAKLHALSLAYKQSHPEDFLKIDSDTIPAWLESTKKKALQDSFRINAENCLKVLESVVDAKVLEKFKCYVNDSVGIFREAQCKARYSVLLHGDCWSNNVMFKYDSLGNVSDLKLIDFQLITVGSPVCDLSYTLYSGGSKEVFDQLDHLLRIYHQALSDTLRALGYDSNQLLPFQVLKGDWKVHCQKGVVLAIAIWKGKMIYQEEVLDLTDICDEDEVDMEKYLNAKYDEETYRERMKDLVLHLYENDYMYG
ncbi:hypothetical protein NQ315_009931 [Exocentrus adspersus]|uniref:CHK kinase-like domain-containing protein n=1 Tax=Exocentrus adspersus TaxID=1586481 RepID=A0AAV8WIQ6_9CUCU|nr:hypothetical protein NQ315_009931 [Exocentrus adspersus]